MFGVAVDHHPLQVELQEHGENLQQFACGCRAQGAGLTHVDRHAVVQPLPDHRPPLDVDVLAVLDGQRLDVFAVQVQGHGPGLHAQRDLVPAAVEQGVHLGVPEHGSDGVFGQAHGVVLHRPVLSVQTDGDLRVRGDPGPLDAEMQQKLFSIIKYDC